MSNTFHKPHVTCNLSKGFKDHQHSKKLNPLTPTTNERISRPNAVFVEERRSPSLAWDKRSPQDANEEAQDVEGLCAIRRSCQTGGDGSYDEKVCHNLPRAILIDEWADDDSHEKGGSQGCDVGISDLRSSEMQVGLDGIGNERGKRKPGEKGDEETNCEA